MNHISHKRTQLRDGKRCVAVVMTLGLGLFLTGCEDLLQVDLPGTVTVEALNNPFLAEVLVNSAIGQVECSYSRFVPGNAAGNEDAFLRIGGDMNGALEYQVFVGGGNTCDTGGDDGFNWFDPFQSARFLSEDIYARLTDDPAMDDYWETADIDDGLVEFDSREQMLGVSALYASFPYQVFGEHLCEITYTDDVTDPGVLQSPDQSLAVAETWVTTALGHIQTHITDFVAAGGTDADARALPYSITTDVEQMAYAQRARIRWARGDVAGAVADATQVSEPFIAYVTRNAGSEDERENHVWLMHNDLLYADVAPVVDWWIDPVGTNPGAPWPLNGAGPEALIPFTGYRELAIAADGRAVDAVGNAITIATAGSTLDSRVPVVFGALLADGTAGWVQQKYTSAGDPVALVKWQEMALIRAMADPANAVARVNEMRAAAGGLTPVTYAPAGGEITNMILEEARREFYLEGRYWSWKIRNTDKLWFPRAQPGEQFNPIGDDVQGAVRMLMQDFEFQLNVKISLADRATLCDADQRPVFTIGG